MRRGWVRFIAVSIFIATGSIVAIVAIELTVARCHCSKAVLGIAIEQLPPVLAGVAMGAILMTIVGFYYRRQSR
jgi:hypothetical protein